MKIEKKVSTSTDMFGNLDIGDLFESHGLLYMKFGGETKVHPVTTLTYSLD